MQRLEELSTGVLTAPLLPLLGGSAEHASTLSFSNPLLVRVTGPLANSCRDLCKPGPVCRSTQHHHSGVEPWKA